jgi:ubiquinone/menaquinone biosynthesis C-methylase UbiE
MVDSKIRAHALNQYSTDEKLASRQKLWTFGLNQQTINSWIFDHLNFQSNNVVLELGSGRGNLWRENLTHIPTDLSLIVSDFSPGMLNQLKANLEGLKDILNTLDFELIDAQEIPYPDQSFDVVIACHMLYHIPNIQKALKEISRVLKPNGKFLITTTYQTHIQELNKLREIAGIPMNLKKERYSDFHIESAAGVLEKYFDIMNTEDYINIVPISPENIHILVNYIKSLFDGSNINVYYKNYDKIMAEITSTIKNEGIFRITGKSGLILAEKKIDY